MENKNNKIAIAQILGTKAFNEGKKRIFALDKSAVKLLTGHNVGNPKSGKIMRAWYENWDLAKDSKENKL